MDLRMNLAGTILIAALVAAGAWHAKFPDVVQRALTQLQLGAEGGTNEQNPESLVYCRKVDWSPDNRKLLSVVRGEYGLDGPLMVHDFDNRPLRMPIDLKGESVAAAALAPDGRHVLVGSNAGRLVWLDLESDDRKVLLEAPGKPDFTAIAISGNGRLLAAASCDGVIYLCDAELRDRASPAPAVLAAGLKSRISDLRFSKDSQRMVAAGMDGWLCVWDLQSGRVLQRWQGHDQPATAAAFLSDDRLISAGLDDTVRIWEISTGSEVWRGEFGLSGVLALAVTADGKTAAWGGHESKVVVWDLENARKKFEIQVPAWMVWDIQFSPDAKLLAVAGTRGTLRVYDAHNGDGVAQLAIGQRL